MCELKINTLNKNGLDNATTNFNACLIPDIFVRTFPIRKKSFCGSDRESISIPKTEVAIASFVNRMKKLFNSCLTIISENKCK